jgi:hypothetical protein
VSIGRLRALENAVELVAKATPGPWTTDGGRYVVHDSRHQVCCGRGRYECCGDPDVAGDYFPICAVEDRGGSEHDPDAIIAAVNFIREHGSALIAELGQEVGAVESFRGSLNSWIMAYPEQCFSEPEPEELFWLRDAKPGLLDRISASMGRHVAKCLITDFDAAFANFTTSPAHTSEARDSERLDWLERFTSSSALLLHNGEGSGSGFTGLGLKNTNRTLRQAIDAAMRQEGGE